MGFKMRGWSPMTNKTFKGGGESRSMPSASLSMQPSPLERRKSKRQKREERELKDFHGKNYKYIYEDKWRESDEKRGITHEFDEEGRLIRRNREGDIIGGTREQRLERNVGRVDAFDRAELAREQERENRRRRMITTTDTALETPEYGLGEFSHGEQGGRIVIDDRIEKEIYDQIRSGNMPASEAEYWTRVLSGKKSGKNLTIDFNEAKPTRGIHTYDDVGAAPTSSWKGGFLPSGSVDRVVDIVTRLNQPTLETRTGFEDIETTTPTLAPRPVAPSGSTKTGGGTETGGDAGESPRKPVVKKKTRKIRKVEKKESKEKKEKKNRGSRSDWAASESYIPQSQRGDA